ncbi:arginyltransferase [Desulfurivibrio sp. D14AmB]|uniref:arginyltransferase n=1 Tax=Desulfurivibrio sp. D14AmB TaxID=3374370 RepID=UPI00376EAE4C
MQFGQGWSDQEELAGYLFDVPSECPYGLERSAVYRQTWCPPLSGELFASLLAAGYRRNGNTIYTMACPNCRGCVPIRLVLADFVANRNQRRVWHKNRDLIVSHGPLEVSEEKLALCERFLSHRYPESDPQRARRRHLGEEQPFARAVEYYSGFFLSSITESYEVAYHLAGKLVGLAVIDLAPDACNAVYFYFDPELEKRSLGTMNILYLIELGKKIGCRYLYLGYWIEGAAAMSYKARFKPHQLLLAGRWQAVE